MKYCSTTGMLPIGVVSPESSVNGIRMTKANSMACCMVATTEDTSRPMPTAARRNSASAA